jgi:hypothetical protein
MRDKNGNYIDSPVKFNDHSIDGIRYGLFTNRHKSIADPVGPDGSGIGSLLNNMIISQKFKPVINYR